MSDGHWRVRRRLATVATAVGVLVAGTGLAGAGLLTRAGPAGDGTAVTPLGMRVTPAGTQTRLGDLPLNAALSPDGRWLLVTNDGQAVQSLQVVDTHTADVVQTLDYRSPEALYIGVAWSADGRHVYASAGGNNKIRVYDADAGHLTETGAIPLPTTNPAGVRINPFPAGLAVSPDGRRLFVADQLADAASAIDLDTGAVTTVPVGHTPYGVTLSADGSTAYVTNQGADTVSVLDVRGTVPVVQGTVQVGTHPNKAVLDHHGRYLYVADGDSDEVSVIDTASNERVRTISLSPYPGAQPGSNADGLVLSTDDATLYVTNAGDNDVAVVDAGSGAVQGLIPTAWYPTSVHLAAGRLWVTNAKGLGAGPNNGPGYPDPTRPGPTAPDQYVGSMMVGTLSAVPLPSRGDLERYTQQTVANDGFAAQGMVVGAGGSGVVPRRPGLPTPIKHVIYVVKENRTFDQVFGSLGKGDGDASLNLFGDDSATNSRALQRRFVTLDNFYADAEISAQGWNWSVAANSNPFAEQLWPPNYSGRNAPYPSENHDPAIAPNRDPNDAYIWHRLAGAGVSFRNYGFYVDQDAAGNAVAGDPVLNANTDHDFRGYDLRCPDSPDTFTPLVAGCGTPRIAEWLREFRGYEQDGTLPTVELVRLPNDHNAGTRPGSPTPRVYIADNDWAFGQLVDAVSHSPYWKDTAIFVTEDDAQNGPDHIDAHRTTSWVISPYSQTGAVDSTFYSTASMLRTIELIVGLGPMTQFDAYSTPMSRTFTGRQQLQPYDAARPAVNFSEVNTAASPMAAQSARQDLTREDQIDMDTFNQAIWKSVKGADSTMPAPRHALRAGTAPAEPAE